MHLVTLSGGLGNQMFQYAFLRRLVRDGHGAYPYFGKIRRSADHNGYELERVFGIGLSAGAHRLDAAMSLPVAGTVVRHALFPRKYRERGISDYGANAAFLADAPGCTRYVGYWQSELFFRGVEHEVRRTFRFRDDRLNGRSRALARALEGSRDTVSLHVRRGDYLATDGHISAFGGICTPEYYRAALSELSREAGPLRVYVFTDDAHWCRKNFPADFTVVDWNTGADSWQDMCLMSRCRHHVMANSSFSWWGAWLDDRPGSRVVAPRRWINTAAAPDVCPERWIRL